jgi:hypothetical protein
VSRVIAWTECAGVPAVGIICKGFMTSARLVGEAEGLAGMRLLEYPPPNMGVQSAGEIHERAAGMLEDLIAALTRPSATAAAAPPPRKQAKPADVVFKGDLNEVNEFFRRNVWSDGLPIMPPTREAVEEMLRFTDRDPDEVIATLRPKRLAATVRGIAVNGVMAGCRPEYMPLLIALIEAIADPRFGVEHVGSTLGWSYLILLNGPIIRELGFSSGQGLLRPQAQANITVSRFVRLCLVNIAGYRIGETDMATFGRNYYPVVAEAEEESPWEPLSVDRGFAKGANVVTIQSADFISYAFLSQGDAENQLRVIAWNVARELGGGTLSPMAQFGPGYSPVLGLTPLIAGILARAGYSRDDVRRYLFKHAVITAREFDARIADQQGSTLKELVGCGKLPACYALSDDPERLVPVIRDPDQLIIVVCGAAERNRSFVAAQIGDQGLNVSREVRLLPDWKARLKQLPGTSPERPLEEMKR